MQNDKINITMNDLNSMVINQGKEVKALSEKNKEIKEAKDELLRERIKTALANKDIERLKKQVEEQVRCHEARINPRAKNILSSNSHLPSSAIPQS